MIRIKKLISGITIACCLAMVAGCSSGHSDKIEQKPLTQEDGTVSFDALYFTDGERTITDLMGKNTYEKFRKMVKDDSTFNGDINGNDFLGFMIDNSDGTEVAAISFNEDKILFQLTISPNYSLPDGTICIPEFSLSGVTLQDSYDDVVNTLGKPTEETVDNEGNVESIQYDAPDSSYVYIGFGDSQVNYIAVVGNDGT